MRNQHQFDSEPVRPIDRDKAALGVKDGSPYLELDGVSLAWEESGEGVPVVCLHSVGHGASDFQLLQREAPSGCRLVLLDWPGHGRSTEDAKTFTVERCVSLLTGFLGAQGIRYPILIGSEFGAAVALAFAIQSPSRVRGLLLCQPEGLAPMPGTHRRSRIRPAFRRTGRALLRLPSYSPAELQEQRIESLQMKHALQRSQASQSVFALRETLRTGLAPCACPILVALAAKSRAYPLKAFQELLAPLLGEWPLDPPDRPKLAIFSGSRSPLWESPARLARVLSGFAGATQPLDLHRHAWTLAAADWPARGLNQWLCTHPGCHSAQALPIDQNPNIPKPRS
jgi:pimeloyl-ACP methyl ester carboxylesterase